MALKRGDILEGKYEIVGQLGAGAMGIVYAGLHKKLGKKVAIKTILGQMAASADSVSRFEREARAAGAIDHPNIVKVFDLGKAPDGALFMVMEHLMGKTLGERLTQSNVLAPDEAVAIVGQMLSGLSAAHRAGIVHRDLKPANVFLVDPAEGEEIGLVKILDFGVSKVIEAADPVLLASQRALDATSSGQPLGTPQYMAPEQARGLTDLDARVDIWASGCVLYQALCGQAPFRGENYHQILLAIVENDVPPPSTLRKDILPAIEQVILTALNKDRGRRYQSASEMRDALFAAVGLASRVGTSPLARLRTKPPVDGKSLTPTRPPSSRPSSRVDAPDEMNRADLPLASRRALTGIFAGIALVLVLATWIAIR